MCVGTQSEPHLGEADLSGNRKNYKKDLSTDIHAQPWGHMVTMVQ